jgi:hypothetical protein
MIDDLASVSFLRFTHSISSIHWQLELLGLIESESYVHGVDRFGFAPFGSGRVVQ